eukprot:3751038-Prymnesium_polylepis.1
MSVSSHASLPLLLSSSLVLPAAALSVTMSGSSYASLPQAYSHALIAAPLATKCVSAALVATVADAIAQSLCKTSRSGRWDWARTRWTVV